MPSSRNAALYTAFGTRQVGVSWPRTSSLLIVLCSKPYTSIGVILLSLSAYPLTTSQSESMDTSRSPSSLSDTVTRAFLSQISMSTSTVDAMALNVSGRINHRRLFLEKNLRAWETTSSEGTAPSCFSYL